MASAAFAGTTMSSSREMKQVEQQAPCPTWYADNEWNVGVSGIYAFNTDDDDNDIFDRGFDDAWGGALDVKYFFRRNFGVGVQIFGLAVDDDSDFAQISNENDDWTWGALGTFTMRFPMTCSRFAPYLWVGGGGYWHGDDLGDLEDNFDDDEDGNDGQFMGQIGAGFEVRFTQHVAMTTDISYNDVEGGEHDFFQLRAGLNFAF
jgi:outer membrane protein W